LSEKTPLRSDTPLIGDSSLFFSRSAFFFSASLARRRARLLAAGPSGFFEAPGCGVAGTLLLSLLLFCMSPETEFRCSVTITGGFLTLFFSNYKSEKVLKRAVFLPVPFSL
jgi:hypothetical protein